MHNHIYVFTKNSTEEKINSIRQTVDNSGKGKKDGYKFTGTYRYQTGSFCNRTGSVGGSFDYHSDREQRENVEIKEKL